MTLRARAMSVNAMESTRTAGGVNLHLRMERVAGEIRWRGENNLDEILVWLRRQRFESHVTAAIRRR